MENSKNLRGLRKFVGVFVKRLRKSFWLLRTGFFAPRATFDTITIRGSKPFLGRIHEALDLLKTRVPETYRLIQNHLVQILEGIPSGAWVFTLEFQTHTMTTLSPKVSQEPLVERAATLAHEAYHCALFTNYKASHPGQKVPEQIYGGEQAERLCLEYQCEVLKLLGADEEVITRTRQAVETHWWEVPSEERDW